MFGESFTGMMSGGMIGTKYQPFLSYNPKIKYNLDIDFDTAKRLCSTSSAFTLILFEAPCYTVSYNANGAEEGEVPTSQTVSVYNAEDKDLLNTNTVAPENTGGLAKKGYGFVG